MCLKFSSFLRGPDRGFGVTVVSSQKGKACTASFVALPLFCIVSWQSCYSLQRTERTNRPVLLTSHCTSLHCTSPLHCIRSTAWLVTAAAAAATTPGAAVERSRRKGKKGRKGSKFSQHGYKGLH